MALQSVFANDLHFGEGDPNQVQDDEREENIDDADLEEGEIEDDEEEEIKTEKPSVKNEEKKEEPKAPVVEPVTTNAAPARSEPKTNHSGDKRRERDKRPPIRGGGGGRKRASEDEYLDHRDSTRKRRRNQDENEEGEFEMMNARGHSPDRLRHDSGGSEYEENAVVSRRQRGNDRPRPMRPSPPPRRRGRGNSRERPGDRRRAERERDRSDRDRRPPKPSNSSNSAATNAAKVKEESICAFYMEGKCSRGSDCPYSHAALPPRKMELCKFYLMDCCAKKEKCLYLHKDFPCKFFHTGKKCRSTAEDCKFSHDPLSETTRAILIKHIETAPREILGDFPRLSREETIQAIEHFSPLPNGREGKRPHIPSLFEVSMSPSTGGADNKEKKASEKTERASDKAESPRRLAFYQDTQETGSADVDNREENSRSIWFGQLRQEVERHSEEIAEPDDVVKKEPLSPKSQPVDYLSTLPPRQRQLYLRIQQQQREPSAIDDASLRTKEEPADDKWYSSDEEDTGKSITDLIKSVKTEMPSNTNVPLAVPNLNLSSLENINVAEIAKVLSTLKQEKILQGPEEPPASETGRRDPRMRDPRMRSQAPVTNMGDVDLRVPQDVDLRLGNRMNADVDLRSGLHPMVNNMDDMGSSDVDFRRIGMAFKPASMVQEIEASFASHPPMDYHVFVVDYIPLDYSIVRVHADWAHLDPRQQKGSSTIRDFTSSDPPSIPLGPASPDPVQQSPPPLPRHYEPEPPHLYSSPRLAPNDPRSRDPRRAAVALPSSQQQSMIPDTRAKFGLLGLAPPGMMPFNDNKMEPSESSYNNSYRPVAAYDRSFEGGGGGGPALESPNHIPVAENRRDPRQRLRALPTPSEPVRSYTPPLNERVFR